jgi:hypothetical protein
VAIFSRDLPPDGLGVLDALPQLRVQVPRRPGTGPTTPQKPSLIVPRRVPLKLDPRAPATTVARPRQPALKPGSLQPGGSFTPATRSAAGPQTAPLAPQNTPGGGGYVPQQPSFAPSAGDGGGSGGYTMPDFDEGVALPDAADLPELPALPDLPGTTSATAGSESNAGLYIVGGIAVAGLGFLASVWLRRRR